jgi:hypothetical protein
MDDASFDRIADLLNALLEHSKHGEELRAELAAEIERAHRRGSTSTVAAPDRRRRERRRRKRQAAA